jgi:hypothetical protein
MSKIYTSSISATICAHLSLNQTLRFLSTFTEYPRRILHVRQMYIYSTSYVFTMLTTCRLKGISETHVKSLSLHKGYNRNRYVYPDIKLYNSSLPM